VSGRAVSRATANLGKREQCRGLRPQRPTPYGNNSLAAKVSRRRKFSLAFASSQHTTDDIDIKRNYVVTQQMLSIS
jgi:hypothetical protein